MAPTQMQMKRLAVLGLAVLNSACGARSTDLGTGAEADAGTNTQTRIGAPAGCFATTSDPDGVYATMDLGSGEVIAKLSGTTASSTKVEGSCPFAVIGDQLFAGGQRVQPKGSAAALPSKSWAVDTSGIYSLEDARVVASEFDTHLLRARLDGSDPSRVVLLDHVGSDVVGLRAQMMVVGGSVYVARADKLYHVSVAGDSVSSFKVAFDGQQKILDSYVVIGNVVYWAANHVGGGIFATTTKDGTTRRLLGDPARKVKVSGEGMLFFLSAAGIETVTAHGSERAVVVALPSTSTVTDYAVTSHRIYWSVLGDGTYSQER